MNNTIETCAWRTEAGYCRVHKADCCRNSPGCCSDCVRRVSARQHEHMVAYMRGLKAYGNPRKSQFEFKKRKASGYNVFRTCSRKRRFPDRNAAMEKARYLFRKKGMQLAVYECPFCGGYHLTSQLRKNLENNLRRGTLAA